MTTHARGLGNAADRTKSGQLQAVNPCNMTFISYPLWPFVCKGEIRINCVSGDTTIIRVLARAASVHASPPPFLLENLAFNILHETLLYLAAGALVPENLVQRVPVSFNFLSFIKPKNKFK